MKTKLIYYGNIDGDIDSIFISSLLKDSIVTSKNGQRYSLDDITRDGTVYINGEWIHCFNKSTDLQFLHYIYLIIEIFELNESVFPLKSSA